MSGARAVVTLSPGDQRALDELFGYFSLRYDTPFGFTRDDVALLEALMLDVSHATTTVAEIRALADRIEALLPPHDS